MHMLLSRKVVTGWYNCLCVCRGGQTICFAHSKGSYCIERRQQLDPTAQSVRTRGGWGGKAMVSIRVWEWSYFTENIFNSWVHHAPLMHTIKWRIAEVRAGRLNSDISDPVADNTPPEREPLPTPTPGADRWGPALHIRCNICIFKSTAERSVWDLTFKWLLNKICHYFTFLTVLKHLDTWSGKLGLTVVAYVMLMYIRHRALG